jgi:hypothetical protein
MRQGLTTGGKGSRVVTSDRINDLARQKGKVMDNLNEAIFLIAIGIVSIRLDLVLVSIDHHLTAIAAMMIKNGKPSNPTLRPRSFTPKRHAHKKRIWER